MSAAPKPFGVVCIKADSRRSEFNRYTSRAEAEAIVRSLAEVGCPAEVVDFSDGEKADARHPGATPDEGAIA
jgi:Lon protease-like protein